MANPDEIKQTKDPGKDQDSNKGQGKQNPGKQNGRREDKDKGKGTFKCKVNDPKWYASSDQLLKDAFSLSFAPVLGQSLGMTNANGQSELHSSNFVPGIRTYILHPVLGNCKLESDAPTVASRQVYSFVRHANSGHANYEAPDLMMYILAHGMVSHYLNSLRRAYGTLSLYDPKNRLLAKALVEAQGFDYETLVSEMANFRMQINIAANKLNQLKVPADFPIFERWRWLGLSYFEDSSKPKSQLYVPRFDSILKFNATKSNTGSCLERIFIRNSSKATLTYSEAVSTLNELLDALLTNEDIGIMSGDIMKAFGSKVSEEFLIAEDFKVLPNTESEPKIQFGNVWTSAFFEKENGSNYTMSDITQTDKGVITESILVAEWDDDTFEQSAAQYERLNSKFLLNLNSEQPTASEVAVATRLVTGYAEDGSAICGTEMCTGMFDIFELSYRDTVFSSLVDAEDTRATRIIGNGAAYEAQSQQCVIKRWDGGHYQVVVHAGPKSNFTIVQYHTLKKMHQVALLSELLNSVVSSFTKTR